jgi:hypothetical protein
LLQIGGVAHTEGRSNGIKIGGIASVTGIDGRHIGASVSGISAGHCFELYGLGIHLIGEYKSIKGLGISLMDGTSDFKGIRMSLSPWSHSFKGISASLIDRGSIFSTGLIASLFGEVRGGNGVRIVAFDKAEGPCTPWVFNGLALTAISRYEILNGVQVGAYCRAQKGNFVQIGGILDRGRDLPFRQRYRVGISWRFDDKEAIMQEVRDRVKGLAGRSMCLGFGVNGIQTAVLKGYERTKACLSKVFQSKDSGTYGLESSL